MRDVVAETAAHGPEEEELRLLAVEGAGARYLSSLGLVDGAIAIAIAVGRGRTMLAVAQSLVFGWAERVNVHQINGAVHVAEFASGAERIMSCFADLLVGTRNCQRPHPSSIKFPCVARSNRIVESTTGWSLHAKRLRRCSQWETCRPSPCLFRMAASMLRILTGFGG